MDQTIGSAETRRILLLMGALATLWLVLGVVRDGVTYHLAPLIVAGLPFIGLGAGPTVAATTRLAVAGAGTALGVTFLLAALGKLAGPSLLPFGGAVTEAFLFSIAGAALVFGVGIYTTGAD